MKQAAILILTLLLVASCQQFFTGSLLTVLARPTPAITKLDSSQAADLVAGLSSNPDPKLANAAMPAIAALVAANPSNPAIVANASYVAVVGSGLDTVMTQSITPLMSTLTSGGTPTKDQLVALAGSVADASASISADQIAVFSALASSASTSSGATALADSGLGSQTLVIAAAAIALSDMKTTLSTSGGSTTLADVLSGTATPPALSAEAQASMTNLAAGVASIDPKNQLLGMLSSTLNIKI